MPAVDASRCCTMPLCRCCICCSFCCQPVRAAQMSWLYLRATPAAADAHMQNRRCCSLGCWSATAHCPWHSCCNNKSPRTVLLTCVCSALSVLLSRFGGMLQRTGSATAAASAAQMSFLRAITRHIQKNVPTQTDSVVTLMMMKPRRSSVHA